MGWFGIDLDGTLAERSRNAPFGIGRPHQAMVDKLMRLVNAGKEVRILTARASDPGQIPVIQQWLADNKLPVLPVTCSKDFQMIELWDDRARQVDPATGEFVVEEQTARHSPPPPPARTEVQIEVATHMGNSDRMGEVYDAPSTTVVPLADTKDQKANEAKAERNLSKFEDAKEEGLPAVPKKEAKLFKYVAHKDDRTRPEHKALDGKILPADSLVVKSMTPPADKNCRCKLEPVKSTNKPIMRKIAHNYYHQQDKERSMNMKPLNDARRILLAFADSLNDIYAEEEKNTVALKQAEYELSEAKKDMDAYKKSSNYTTGEAPIQSNLSQKEKDALTTIKTAHINKLDSLKKRIESATAKIVQANINLAKIKEVRSRLEDDDKKHDQSLKLINESRSRNMAKLDELTGALDEKVPEEDKKEIDALRKEWNDVSVNGPSKDGHVAELEERTRKLTGKLKPIAQKAVLENQVSTSLEQKKAADEAKRKIFDAMPDAAKVELLLDPSKGGEIRQITGASVGSIISKSTTLTSYQKKDIEDKLSKKKLTPAEMGEFIARSEDDNKRVKAAVGENVSKIPDALYNEISREIKANPGQTDSIIKKATDNFKKQRAKVVEEATKAVDQYDSEQETPLDQETRQKYIDERVTKYIDKYQMNSDAADNVSNMQKKIKDFEEQIPKNKYDKKLRDQKLLNMKRQLQKAKRLQSGASSQSAQDAVMDIAENEEKKRKMAKLTEKTEVDGKDVTLSQSEAKEAYSLGFKDPESYRDYKAKPEVVIKKGTEKSEEVDNKRAIDALVQKAIDAGLTTGQIEFIKKTAQAKPGNVGDMAGLDAAERFLDDELSKREKSNPGYNEAMQKIIAREEANQKWLDEHEAKVKSEMDRLEGKDKAYNAELDAYLAKEKAAEEAKDKEIAAQDRATLAKADKEAAEDAKKVADDLIANAEREVAEERMALDLPEMRDKVSDAIIAGLDSVDSKTSESLQAMLGEVKSSTTLDELNTIAAKANTIIEEGKKTRAGQNAEKANENNTPQDVIANEGGQDEPETKPMSDYDVFSEVSRHFGNDPKEVRAANRSM